MHRNDLLREKLDNNALLERELACLMQGKDPSTGLPLGDEELFEAINRVE